MIKTNKVQVKSTNVATEKKKKMEQNWWSKEASVENNTVLEGKAPKNKKKKTELLVMQGHMGNQEVDILVDSRAQANMVNDEVAKQAGLEVACEGPTIRYANGQETGSGIARDCPLQVGNYRDQIDLHVAPITRDVILGKKWLDEYEPQVFWRQNQLQFQDQDGQEVLWKGKMKTQESVPDVHSIEVVSALQFKKEA